MSLVSLRDTTLALLIATDRAADYMAARSTTDLAAQALIDMAEEYDSASRAFVRALDRVVGEAQGLLADTHRVGVIARYGNVSSTAAADAVEHAARARALLECWSRLATEAVGAPAEQFVALLHRQIGDELVGWIGGRAWVDGAVGVLRLALAMVHETRAIAAAERAAREAAEQAERERLAEEKKERLRRRRAEAKAGVGIK